MKPRIGISVLMVLAVGMVLGVQSDAAQAGPSATAYAQGKGCVRPGKQAGCITLHDIKQHRYYNLSFDSSPNKPDLYTAISFEGIGYSHDSHCGEGQPVHVHEWKPLPGKCSQPASKPQSK